MQVNQTQAQSLMATSIAINNSIEVNGSEALSREENNDWNIWQD